MDDSISVSRPRSGHHILGRETFLAPIEWQKNEWPVVNKTGSLSLEMNVLTLPIQKLSEQVTKDDFDKSRLGFAWNYINNPIPENYSLTEKQGFLRLKGSATNLKDAKPVTFVGRRQQHEVFEASTLLDFEPINETDEAGLTVFMDFKANYSFSIKQIKGKRTLILKYNLNSIEHIAKEIPINEGAINLKINGTLDPSGYSKANYYTFSFAQNNNPYTLVGKVEAKYLSTETAGGFTGVYVRIFATGNGQNTTSNADFDWFEYVGK